MDLQNSFSAAKSNKFPTKPVLDYPPHLKYIAALPRKTQQEGQHPLTGQRAANFMLLANQ